VLSNPANAKRTVSLTKEQFRYSFGNAVTEQESDALHERLTIPGPGRPLFEDASANFHRNSPAAVDTHAADRGPLLLVSGTEDHTVPRKVTDAVARLYADGPSVTDYEIVEGRGLSLTIDAGWVDVAELTLTWIGTHAPTANAGSS
jgi:hypothetical protein